MLEGGVVVFDEGPYSFELLIGFGGCELFVLHERGAHYQRGAAFASVTVHHDRDTGIDERVDLCDGVAHYGFTAILGLLARGRSILCRCLVRQAVRRRSSVSLDNDLRAVEVDVQATTATLRVLIRHGWRRGSCRGRSPRPIRRLHPHA